MKKLLLLSLLTLAACDNQKQIAAADLVDARVLLAQGSAYGATASTYVKDEHGHLGVVHGVRGAVGDVIQVYCLNGAIDYTQ